MLACLLSGPLALHVTGSSNTSPTSLFALSSILFSFAATLCQACPLSQYPRHSSLSALSHSMWMPQVRALASKCLHLFLFLVCTDLSFSAFLIQISGGKITTVSLSCLLFFLFFFFSFLVLEIRSKVFSMPWKYLATVLHHQSLGPPSIFF